MTRFLDGPAKGQFLSLRRLPFFLRVVHGTKWDALDQLDDEPRASETIYAYQLTARPTWMHVLVRGKDPEGRGGFKTDAVYKLCEVQPTDAQMRTQREWEDWCVANKPSNLEDFT